MDEHDPNAWGNGRRRILEQCEGKRARMPRDVEAPCAFGGEDAQPVGREEQQRRPCQRGEARREKRTAERKEHVLVILNLHGRVDTGEGSGAGQGARLHPQRRPGHVQTVLHPQQPMPPRADLQNDAAPSRQVRMTRVAARNGSDRLNDRAAARSLPRRVSTVAEPGEKTPPARALGGALGWAMAEDAGRGWRRVVGTAMVAFGWVYPHFSSDPSLFAYFYGAPTGLLPCPTLSLVIGLSLLARGFGVMFRRWIDEHQLQGVCELDIESRTMAIWSATVILVALRALDPAPPRRQERQGTPKPGPRASLCRRTGALPGRSWIALGRGGVRGRRSTRLTLIRARMSEWKRKAVSPRA